MLGSWALACQRREWQQYLASHVLRHQERGHRRCHDAGCAMVACRDAGWDASLGAAGGYDPFAHRLWWKGYRRQARRGHRSALQRRRQQRSSWQALEDPTPSLRWCWFSRWSKGFAPSWSCNEGLPFKWVQLWRLYKALQYVLERLVVRHNRAQANKLSETTVCFDHLSPTKLQWQEAREGQRVLERYSVPEERRGLLPLVN